MNMLSKGRFEMNSFSLFITLVIKAFKLAGGSLLTLQAILDQEFFSSTGRLKNYTFHFAITLILLRCTLLHYIVTGTITLALLHYIVTLHCYRVCTITLTLLQCCT